MALQDSAELTRPAQVLPPAPNQLYSSPLAHASTTSAVQHAPDILYAMPYYVPVETTLKAIGIEVTTGGTAAGTARLGIYNDSSAAPSTLVVDAGTVVVDTAAFVSKAITNELAPGWYWLACVFENIATEAIIRSLPAVSNGMHWLGATSGTDTVIHSGWSVAFTFAALPDPFTGGGALMTTQPPMIAVYF